MEIEVALTAKQETFAQLFFQGHDQAEAKRFAYPDCKLTGNALYVNASRLANMAKIRLRVNELSDAAVTPLIADVVERKKYATKVMRDPSVRTRDQLAANKLTGDYERDFATQTASHHDAIVRVVYGDTHGAGQ